MTVLDQGCTIQITMIDENLRYQTDEEPELATARNFAEQLPLQQQNEMILWEVVHQKSLKPLVEYLKELKDSGVDLIPVSDFPRLKRLLNGPESPLGIFLLFGLERADGAEQFKAISRSPDLEPPVYQESLFYRHFNTMLESIEPQKDGLGGEITVQSLESAIYFLKAYYDQLEITIKPDLLEKWARSKSLYFRSLKESSLESQDQLPGRLTPEKVDEEIEVYSQFLKKLEARMELEKKLNISS